jgi:uncharacterized protein (TIGR00369 family)
MLKKELSFFNHPDNNGLAEVLGMRTVEVNERHCIVEMEISAAAMNLKGGIHGGTLVALADTTAGYGCFANLPEAAESFTTVELKCNFTGTPSGDKLSCTGTCRHSGKTTQVWDATVIDCDSGKPVAEFRCTQLIIYPKS